MNKLTITLSILGILFLGCNTISKTDYKVGGAKSKIIVKMIDAVNEKNADNYVIGFADNVQVFVESEMKVNGREALKTNRANHFKNHPNVRSEIQHLVEIDNKVILHDKLWLDESDETGQNIVEVFTFENDKVLRVDVIQPKDLFKR